METISLRIKKYNTLEELSSKEQELVQAALDAAQKAYAPYSNFKVGAAVLLNNNEIISGCNQENAATPSGICAERVALNYAGAKYPKSKVLNMAIIALKNGKITSKAVSPCGACRQVILESSYRSGSPFPIILAGQQQIIKVISSDELLPLFFGPGCLD